MKRTIIALTSALILAPTLVIAADNAQHIKFIGDNQTQAGVQFQGPVEVVKVQSLLDSSNPFMEKKVVVEGNLVRQLRKDTFMFSDGSNEIQVELDDDIHLNATLTPETKVRLFGNLKTAARLRLKWIISSCCNHCANPVLQRCFRTSLYFFLQGSLTRFRTAFYILAGAPFSPSIF